MTPRAEHTQGWIPFALRRKTLIVFAAFLAILALSIGMTFHVSDQQHGLATPLAKYRYLWTYSPTFLFITLSGLWALVDYNLRQLAPWRAMSKSPNDYKSMSLDYTSHNHYQSFYKSWRNKHWDVTLATAGTICLDIMIVASTGLFAAQPIAIVENNHHFSTLTALNQTSFSNSSQNEFSSAYAMTMYGLPFPKGTASDFAYATIDDSQLPRSSTSQLSVDAVWPDVSCELAQVSLTLGLLTVPRSYNDSLTARVDVNGRSNCRGSYYQGLLNATSLDKYPFQLSSTPCYSPDNKAVLSTKILVVAGQLKTNNGSISEALQMMKNLTNGYTSNNQTWVTVRNKTMSSKAVCVLCTMRPRAGTASLMSNQDNWAATLVKTSRSMNNDSIIGQNADYKQGLEQKMIEAFTSGLSLDSTYLTGLGGAVTVEKTLTQWSGTSGPFFEILNRSNPRTTLESMVDEQYISTGSRLILQLVASQILANQVFPKSRGEAYGSITHVGDRLTVSPLALGLIVGLLAILTSITLALCVRPHAITPKDPSTIASKATMFAGNRHILDALKSAEYHHADTSGTTLEHTDNIQTLMPEKDFGSHTTTEAQKESMIDRGSIKSYDKRQTVKWWQPWSSSILCRLLTVLTPCVLITLLEVLYWRSKKHQGIYDVAYDSIMHHAWVYIPVIIVFMMNSMFTAASLTDRIIQPYAALRQKTCRASDTLSVDFVHQLTLWAMWIAMKLKHLGTATAIFATILGATLPITISGLYRLQDAHRSAPVLLSGASTFNRSLNIGALNVLEGHYPVPAFVIMQNLSFPQWTFEKYAVPSLELPKSNHQPAQDYLNQNSTLDVDLPAVFGVANCSRLPQDMITISYAKSFITGSIRSGMECPPLSWNIISVLKGDFIAASWQGLGAVEVQRPNGTVQPRDPPNDTALATYHGKWGIPQGCPSTVAIITKGSYSNQSGLTIDDTIAFGCSPYVAQEMVHVSLTVPDLRISTKSPPTALPNTQSFFSETELVNNGAFTPFFPITGQINDPKAPTLLMDTFFKALFRTGNGPLPSELVSKDKKTLTRDDSSIQRLVDRIEHVYGYTVAQVYNGKKRSPVLTQDAADDFNGTIIASIGSRVVQDHTMTRVIQGTLAVMALCAIISMIMIDSTRLLPQNPCSLAAVASLLEKSSILNEDIIPPGSEFLNEKQLKERGAFEHYLFSLGWWGSGEKAWYGIDVGKAEKDR